MRANNTFTNGLNQDISKHLVPQDTLVDSFQVEILNKEGTNFSATCANGNDVAFTIPSGYEVMAAKEYNGLLYLVIVNKDTDKIEFGSYRSPESDVTEAGVPVADAYQAFQNLNGSRMRLNYADVGIEEDPEFIDLELQQDYDDSMNVIITSSGFNPLLVNSGFVYRDNKFYSTERSDYSTTDILDQVKLIIDSFTSLDITFDEIVAGGSLKPGNYVYYFSYLTEDLNESELVNQSSICQVTLGSGDNLRGGVDTDNASKTVSLILTSVDQTFSYIQPYFTYTSGDETKVKQTIKIDTPIRISGSTINFRHNGFEPATEIPTSEIGINFSGISSAGSLTTSKGYLFLANTSEPERRDEALSNFAKNIQIRASSVTKNSEFYKDPKNVYEKLGYFSGETYLVYAVFKYTSGGYSPAYPTSGFDYSTQLPNTDGLIKLPDVWSVNSTSSRNVVIKHLTANFPSDTSDIQDLISEVFLVRPERQNSTWIDQGIVFPTFKVPGVPNSNRDITKDFYLGSDDGKRIPLIEGMIDSYDWNAVGTSSVNGSKRFDIYSSMALESGGKDLINGKDWGYYGALSMSNEPFAAGALPNATISKLVGEVDLNIRDLIIWREDLLGHTYEAGTRFIFNNINYKSSGSANYKIDDIEFINENSYASGSNFISKLFAIYGETPDNPTTEYKFDLSFMPYFGISFEDNLYSNQNVNNPLGIKHRRHNQDGSIIEFDDRIALDYNEGDTRPSGAIVNLYSAEPLSIDQYYPNADSLAFNQIGKRYSINDLPSSTTDVYGGDCYIGEVYYTTYHSPYKDPSEITPDENNNDCGTIFSVMLESPNNLAIRHKYIQNASDLDSRDFYPANKDYREKRYQDSVRVSPGYAHDETDVDYFPNPSILPDVKSNFFTRIFHSAKHIPNSFVNGYRRITNGFQDYDTSMGPITKIVGYGNDLAIIFEHGVGLTPVNQRVQTGSDAAGSIFIEPSGVLSSQLGIRSYSTGSQHPYSVLKTDHFVYGIDAQRGIIWQLGPNGLKEISEGVISSKIIKTSNPRTGYDPIKKLVYFAADEWCYVYSEHLGKFAFTSDGSAGIYARLYGEGMFSFRDRTSYLWKENATMYGSDYSPYLEFVINENFSFTKVFDYINLYSNNVSPDRIEFHTLNYDGTINQKCTIQQGVDFWTQENKIKYRDKKFVAQIPRAEEVEYKELDWGLENRMRDKYVIVKVIYTSKNFELNSIGTEYRISKS